MPAKARYFAFIESNTTGTGHLFINRAQQKGLNVIFITNNPFKYEFLKSELIQPVILDTTCPDKIVNYLMTVDRLEGVASSSEYFIQLACNVAKRLGLRSADQEAVGLCRDKGKLVESLGGKVPGVPITYRIENLNQLEKINSKLIYPVVAKPAQGSGSVGVKLCADKKILIEHITQVLSSQVEQVSSSIIVQEYIEGEEFSVETFGCGRDIQVIGITKKHLGEPPYFLEIGHDYPANIQAGLKEKITRMVVYSLQQIGLLFGPAHTEIRIRNGEPYLIEINPRLAGGMIPELIKISSGIDLIDLWIDAILGRVDKLPISSFISYASIRFVIPKSSGIISNLTYDFNSHDKTISTFKLNKQVGDEIIIRGDFRDRIGYFITYSANSLEEVSTNADRLLANISIEVSAINHKNETKDADTGRLKDRLSKDAFDIVNPNLSLLDKQLLLNYQVEIDEAHILMLYKQRLITREQAKSLLLQIKALQENNFESIINLEAPRGLYLLYEQALIKKVGKIGGLLHIGRSRNDINATIFQLGLRKNFFDFFRILWVFRSQLLIKVSGATRVVLPIYSQYQTALPGTLAHYLLGIDSSLSRDQDALMSFYSFLDSCPLGAGAGGGTSIPIEPSITAGFLGYTKVINNSIDAVANRDQVIRMLSIMNTVALIISRLAEDLQLWSMNEFGYIRLPDNLCGGSSMMPQKKNPYLLEKIKGRVVSFPGYLTTAISCMMKVPFGNSIEVGTEAVRIFSRAYEDLVDAIKLLTLVLDAFEVNIEKTNNSASDNFAIATYLADQLVLSGQYDFRTAHHLIGQKIRQTLDSGKTVSSFIADMVEEYGIDANISPLSCADNMNYGGGPGTDSVLMQLDSSTKHLNKSGLWLKQVLASVSSRISERQNEVLNLIN